MRGDGSGRHPHRIRTRHPRGVRELPQLRRTAPRGRPAGGRDRRGDQWRARGIGQSPARAAGPDRLHRRGRPLHVVKLVQDVRDGRRDHSVEELFESAAPYIGTLILNGILAAIGIGIGLVLLIVPGLILITIWAVVAPAIVVEGAGVIEAFGRSRDLVRGNGWPVFGAIVIAYLIVLGVSFVTAGVGDAIADDAGHVILGTIGDILAAPILALVASALFFDLGGGAGAPAD